VPRSVPPMSAIKAGHVCDMSASESKLRLRLRLRGLDVLPRPECIEINGLEDAVKLAVCSCIKFDSQK
jgi:hypothetical protein